MNAIALFVLSTLGTLLLLWVKLAGADGKPRSLYGDDLPDGLRPLRRRESARFLFALTFCAVWIAVGGLLYRKSIFIKV